MTDTKEFLFQIQYLDNTYRMVNWTTQEWEKVCNNMGDDKRVCVLDNGIFVLTDIRAIIQIKEEEPEEKPEGAAPEEGQLTEWGFVDPDVAEYLKDLGIPLGGVSK